MGKALLKLLDDIAPGLLDDLIAHLDALIDILGIFSLPLAIGLVAVIGLAGSYLQRRLLRRTLGKMRELALQDVLVDPVLEINPAPKRFLRVVKRKPRLLTIRLDAEGIRIVRPKRVEALAWSDVARWSRDGLADWKLSGAHGAADIALTNDDGLSEADLKRIDNRLALYVSERPQSTVRQELADARVKLRAGVRKIARRAERG